MPIEEKQYYLNSTNKSIIKDPSIYEIFVPSGNYQIVNTLSKIAVEQVKDLGYTVESFQSLMEANECYMNDEYLILIKNR